MSNNFGSIDIIVIDELTHVVSSSFNLVNIYRYIYFMNKEHNLTSNLDNE
jgi:hypothetical protein